MEVPAALPNKQLCLERRRNQCWVKGGKGHLLELIIDELHDPGDQLEGGALAGEIDPDLSALTGARLIHGLELVEGAGNGRHRGTDDHQREDVGKDVEEPLVAAGGGNCRWRWRVDDIPERMQVLNPCLPSCVCQGLLNPAVVAQTCVVPDSLT